MSEGLFPIAGGDIKVTSDDCYTPKWVFDAMGLRFDLDVAAPVGGPWHVPCDRWYTAEDDGLTSPWEGLVWCNPPYSNFRPWVDRFVQQERMVLMGILLRTTRWMKTVMHAAEAVSINTVEFDSPNGARMPRACVFTAFRGVGTEPAERLAAADPYGAVLYGKAAA